MKDFPQAKTAGPAGGSRRRPALFSPPGNPFPRRLGALPNGCGSPFSAPGERRPHLKCPSHKSRGLVRLFDRAVEAGDVREGPDDLRVIRPQSFFVDGQRAQKKGLGLLVAPLKLIEQGQIPQIRGHVVVFGASGFFMDRQRALVEGPGQLVSPLGQV